jgi:hypothetical protein
LVGLRRIVGEEARALQQAGVFDTLNRFAAAETTIVRSVRHVAIS